MRCFDIFSLYFSKQIISSFVRKECKSGSLLSRPCFYYTFYTIKMEYGYVYDIPT